MPLKNDSRCSENITSLGCKVVFDSHPDHFLRKRRSPLIVPCFVVVLFSGTSPKGDITLIEGSDLEINCTIFEVQGLRNSSNIVWRVNNAELNSSLVSTLDERTAQLKIPNVTVGHSGKYWCVLKPNDGVCLNSVCIGSKWH